MTKPDAISKVRKLQARACHPGTPKAEAATAISKAQELILQHGISADDLASPAQTGANGNGAGHRTRQRSEPPPAPFTGSDDAGLFDVERMAQRAVGQMIDEFGDALKQWGRRNLR